MLEKLEKQLQEELNFIREDDSLIDPVMLYTANLRNN